MMRTADEVSDTPSVPSLVARAFAWVRRRRGFLMMLPVILSLGSCESCPDDCEDIRDLLDGVGGDCEELLSGPCTDNVMCKYSDENDCEAGPLYRVVASLVRLTCTPLSDPDAISSDCLASWAGMTDGEAAVGLAAAAAAPGLQEFVVPGTDPVPIGIVAGPDGNLWFTSPGADRIGRLTPGGVVTLFAVPTSKSLPFGITAGSDGNLWFTEAQANRIGRITPAGVVTEFVLPDEASPMGITAGPGGAVWFTEGGLNRIGRLTTAGVLNHFDLPGGSDGGPSGIAAGADGNLWYTDPGQNAIGRLTPAGQATLFPLPTAEAMPFGIAAGGDGNVWFTEFLKGKVGRITPAGAITEFPLPNLYGQPFGIAGGPDGALWFTQAASDMIGRITTAGAVTEYDLGRPGAGPFGIAAGPGNTIWFSESLASRIGRLPAGGGGGGGGSCTPNATTLCLAGGRFKVNAQWVKRNGDAGAGQAVALTGDTGYFWFFGSSNVEAVVKVIDACGFTDRFWVFAGGLTDVNTTLTVSDMKTGELRTYVNPQGTPFAPVQDTSAFATCDASVTTAAPFDGELAARFDGDGELVLDEQSVSLAARVAAERRVVDDLVEAVATRQAAARPMPAPSTGVNGPQGSDYDFELLLGKDVDGDGGVDAFGLGGGTGDNRVLFDGNAELLDAYCCNLDTRPSVVESFVANGNGTSTLTITATSPNGNDLFPGGLIGDNQTLTDAIVSIGFWNGAEPLDWSPAPVVQSATVELFVANASLGGVSNLNVGTFFGAPGTWNGHFAIAFTNQAGKAIDKVIVRLVVPTPGGGGPSTCVPNATTLCLAQGRFEVKAQWQKRNGDNGAGQAVGLTGDTGYFWFFGSSNVEAVVKVIDACTFTNRFWVFAGGLTDVSTTLTVTDKKTGAVRTYINPQGTPFAPVQDTVAFATCP